VDYVKVDYCRARPAPAKSTYTRVQQALAATRRPIVLNICDWGYQQPWIWGPGVGSTWRTTGDYFSYGAPRSFWNAMLKVADLNERLASYSRPGAFNDPNALLVGTGFLTPTEERTQFSLWSMLAAPLIAGGEVTSMSSQTLATLTNSEVIGIDQDPAGLQGNRIVNDHNHQVWLRRLADGSEALLVINTGKVAGIFHVDVSKIGLAPTTGYLVRDVWQRRTWRVTGPMQIHVWPHDVRMLRVRAQGIY
jgi:alpha-galactosidase